MNRQELRQQEREYRRYIMRHQKQGMKFDNVSFADLAGIFLLGLSIGITISRLLI